MKFPELKVAPMGIKRLSTLRDRLSLRAGSPEIEMERTEYTDSDGGLDRGADYQRAKAGLTEDTNLDPNH